VTDYSRQQPAVQLNDAELCRHRLQDQVESEARTRRVQPVRPQGERHRLLPRFATAGWAGRGGEPVELRSFRLTSIAKLW